MIDAGGLVIIPLLYSRSKGYINAKVSESLERNELDVGHNKGAIAEFSGYSTQAKTDIKAGEEIMFTKVDKDDKTFELVVQIMQNFSNYISDVKGDEFDGFRRQAWKLITDAADEIAELLPSYDDLVAIKGRYDHFAANNTLPVEILESEAYCLDFIKRDTSTIPGAGFGAFATIPITKGGYVAPIPMVGLRKSELMPSNHTEELEMVINYCFMHNDSDLLLYPRFTMINYINHDASPNVEIQLVTSKYPQINDQSVWSNKTVDEVLNDAPVMMFELVATRDISEGEELFLDYGKEWQQKAEQHKKTWISDFHSVTVWNALKEFTPMSTMDEGEYPENLDISCFIDMDNEQLDTFKWKECELNDSNLYFCEITSRTHREDDSYEYTVEVYFSDGEYTVIEEVPHRAIWFVEDETAKNVPFRHPIMLPDHVFPDKWKNLN